MMSKRLSALCILGSILVSGCAAANYYDELGNELPGLPFVWKDAEGKPHLAYVRTSTGLGEATFTVERNEAGGYTRFTNNLDSTAVGQATGEVIEKAFLAGKMAAKAEFKARISAMEDAATRSQLLRKLDETIPE